MDTSPAGGVAGGIGGAPGMKARALAGQLAASANQAVQQWTVRKYTLPDKNVASQVLMYRQLLHTKCRPGLKLSREYQGTPAQKAVLHMPWWSLGIEETKRMEIAYDNLIRRLWLHGAILPHQSLGQEDTLLDDNGMPPVPHDYWVARLGFQQADPVTDFRSGGVLSLAMMVWIVESCPDVYKRFVRPSGDASVLPFGITSINITDMMAKFLMLSKAVDRMDALLSQKPFWRMFADPNALLACQEISMDMLADVVVELRSIRQQAAEGGADEADVTVFDFAHILAVTEKRVEHDLLGAGPGSVQELRAIHQKLKARYQQQLQSKLQRLKQHQQHDRPISGDTPTNAAREAETGTAAATSSTEDTAAHSAKQLQQQVLQQANELGAAASSFAGSVFSKMKAAPVGFNPLQQLRSSMKRPPGENEAVVFDREPTLPSPPTTPSNTTPTPSGGAATSTASDEDDWAGKDIQGATEQIGNFSIGDEEEDAAIVEG